MTERVSAYGRNDLFSVSLNMKLFTIYGYFAKSHAYYIFKKTPLPERKAFNRGEWHLILATIDPAVTKTLKKL